MANTSTALNRTSIKNLEVDLPNVMLIALLIGKQPHRCFKPLDYGKAPVSTEERAVWNFTVRDSPRDYINVTFWGKPDTISQLDNVTPIGCLVEITCPRISLRKATNVGEQFCPVVTSPFHLTINEDTGNAQKVRGYSIPALMRLLNLPTKPMFNYTTIDYIFKNIHQINGLLFDLLVAVRQVGEVRFVSTKNGMQQLRKVIVFDSTNPAMAITFWNTDDTTRANMWKPRETILFITDCKVQYDTFSNSAIGTPSMKTIITENPEGKEGNILKNYAMNAHLHSSAVMDQLLGVMPEPAFIKTIMNIREIQLKLNQISKTKSVRVEENQFAVILYAYVTKLDIDGLSRIFSTRCSLCKSMTNQLEECQNPICLSNTSNQVMDLDKIFDLRIEVSDRTGTLTQCRLSGQNAETVFNCSPSEFSSMSDEEKMRIKWKYLMEFCELRLVILLKNDRPMITVLTCTRADVSVHGVN